jgi:hypothetical protein
MKHPMRSSVENAVAVWALVLYKHVIVQMLPAAADKQPIDQALAACARKHRMHVLAHQPAAQEQRVRGNTDSTGLLDPQHRNVEGIEMLALN